MPGRCSRKAGTARADRASIHCPRAARVRGARRGRAPSALSERAALRLGAASLDQLLRGRTHRSERPVNGLEQRQPARVGHGLAREKRAGAERRCRRGSRARQLFASARRWCSASLARIWSSSASRRRAESPSICRGTGVHAARRAPPARPGRARSSQAGRAAHSPTYSGTDRPTPPRLARGCGRGACCHRPGGAWRPARRRQRAPAPARSRPHSRVERTSAPRSEAESSAEGQAAASRCWSACRQGRRPQGDS